MRSRLNPYIGENWIIANMNKDQCVMFG